MRGRFLWRAVTRTSPRGRAAVFGPAVLVAVALAVSRSAPGIEAPGVRSLYPLGLPFLHFGPLRPGDGDVLDLTIAYANTFSHSWQPNAIKTELGTVGRPFLRSEAEELHRRYPNDTLFFVDGEVTRVALFGAVSLGKGISVGLEIPWISFGALQLDQAIEDFHRAFGLPSSQRPDFPRDRFQVVLQAPNGPLEFFDRTPSAGLGDMVLTVSWRGETATRWHLAADAALKLPTGNPDEFRGSGSVDGGVLLGAWRSFGSSGRWTAQIECGVVVPGPYRASLPLILDPAPFLRLLLGVQARVGSGTVFSLAGVWEQSVLHGLNLGDVAAPNVQVSLGIAQRVFTRAYLELSVTEHIPRLGDTADVGAALQLRWGFPE